MIMPVKTLRRSVLATPGSNPAMLRKAAESEADEVFLDLEDAVAPQAKASARATVIQALNECHWGRKVVVVRINDVRTPWAYRDLVEVVEGAGAHIDDVMVPKVEGPEDLVFVARLLDGIEAHIGLPRRLGVEVQIESAAGCVRVDEIARVTDRVRTIVFGPADYAADLGMPTLSVGASQADYPGHVWHYAMARVLNAARAVGVLAIDGPFGAFQDLEGLRTSARLARSLGFDGKWAVHPGQIAAINEIFTPSAAEVARARGLIAAYRQASAEGRGAARHEGEMIDAASVRMAEGILSRHEQITGRP
jgi:citrate lyase subunit beta/citryl-CoA lyase